MAKIKPKFAALASIKCEKQNIPAKDGTARWYERWVADCGTSGGKRIRIAKSSKEECVRSVNEWYASLKGFGDRNMAATLTPIELSQALYIFALLKKHGITKPARDIIEDYVWKHKTAETSVTTREAYERYFAKFGEQQVAQKEFVRSRVAKFAAQFADKMVCDITAQDVKDYLDGHPEWSASTWNGVMTYVKSFLGWCAKKSNGYCAENPIADMERKAVMRERPRCATPEDVRKVFDEVQKMDAKYRDLMLLRMTLAFFCGMRSGEIERQKFEDIMIGEGTIVVSEAKGEQSGGVGRAFKIPDTALAWLKVVDMDKARETTMSRNSYIRWRKMVYDAAKVDMPDNAGRHSFVSYHVALHGNPRMTEGIVGTGDTMRKRHYDARATHKAAEEYFAILPSAPAAAVAEQKSA